MATMNSDLLITKTTVILDQPSDWQKWIFLRKDSAQRNDLWAYVNPNVALETVLKLEDEKPAKKEAGAFYGRERQVGIVYDLEHLDEHEYRKYSAWYTSYQKELTKFEKKELALRQFNSEIATTISERRLHWIMNLDTPHARLRKLKNQLCPSTAERETQLLSQYIALRKMPKRANIESWLDSWEELLELMAAAEMAEVKGTRAQRDFLDSVQSTDDSWATSQRISMITKQEEGESFLPAVDLVGRFRLYYRQMKPVASTLGTFAALGDPQEVSQQSQISQDTDKFRKINCLCGEKHRFIDCPYVNSAKRSSGWKADLDMKKKFDTIRSRGEGSRISAVLRSVEAKLAKQGQQSKPQSAAFDDGSTKSGRSSNACLQVEATQQPSSLLTRWILDPGSNLHVSNHRNSTWRKLADANAHDEILAGGQRIPIKEWGEVKIMINTPHGTSPIKLTWVAYIPSFFTSLVALSRCRTMGIEFDSGRDCLYQKSPKNVVCKLSPEGGHWLMDSDENERPRVEDLRSTAVAESTSVAKSVNAAEKRRIQAVKPSYADRRPLELTAEEAHEIWGHPSAKVISKLEQGVDGVKIKEGTIAPTWETCTTCIEAKLHKFKSRRPPREPATRPFERLAIDLVQLRKTGERCYNGDVWLLHAVCQNCKLHLAACLPNKSAPMLLTTIERLLARIETQYGVKVRAIKIDGERGYSLLHQLFLDRVLDIADYEGEVEELEISELLELAAPLDSQGTKMLEEDEAHDQLIEELLQQSAKGEQSKPVRSIDLGGSLVSPNTIGRRSRDASVEEEISLPKGYEPVQGDQEAPNRRENNAPKRTDPAITSDNIVAGKRTRGSAHAAYLSTFAVTYLSTFASAINPVKVRELHEPKK
ncbi:hypothetical protein PtrV1_09214 [Pyrenophora tritici-repentis]|nr:hypothetical protein PtrV1_09214 [Pyrenophora tritici-repentis]